MKVLLALVAAALSLLALSGCSSSGSLWRHPATGDTKICASRGIGWLGAPLAAVQYGECKTQLEEKGYQKIRPLTSEEMDQVFPPGEPRPKSR